jgi:prepilin-type N-terminal cleavage/methylation domain-containing protein
MKHYAKAQRGFTLIEMSIVLVIIGLIVGGILKGQELIESSRQKNAISQVDRVRAAVTTFVDRYKAFPGDYGQAQANVLAGIGDGNDNGFLGAAGGTNVAAILAVDGTAASSEEKYFFSHIAAAGLIGGAGPNPAATAAPGFSGVAATVSPLPSSAFPSSGLTIAYGVHQGGTTPETAAFHWLRMSQFTAGALVAADGIISGQRAFQLDTKYDDGQAMTGSIRTTATSAAGGTECGTAGGAVTYAAASTQVACILLFQIN